MLIIESKFQEFTGGDNIASKVNWMFVDDDFDGPARRDDSSTKADGTCDRPCKTHGTGMLAFVTGRLLGSSKNVEPWLVRVPRRNPDGGGYRPQDWLRGVSLINQRITERTEATQAIVSLSWMLKIKQLNNWGGIEFREIYKASLAAEIRSLIDKGVLVVTGSGNQRVVSSPRTVTTGFPLP